MIGRTLSHYRITAALGAGGMGEVYRATDTALGREVAIKVLPPEVAESPERLGRFKREAQLLASLNHPNIAAIHGLEEADGKPFLALELVEGEDLAQRLERGALPVDEALEIAKQVAEALEEAHGRGIVHRDLKPANVKLTVDGRVKVLDFGLAKAWTADAPGGRASAASLSQSPTLASGGTLAGVILGTAAYMSPEQARGKPVDKRTDVWAFGVLLWEMLTGRALFAGDTVTDVIAAVMTQEPDMGALPAATPGPVRRLVSRCLRRDPRTRLPDIGSARLELQEVLSGAAIEPRSSAQDVEGAVRAEHARRVRERAAWAAVAVLAAAVAGVLGVGRLTQAPARATAVRFATDAPEGWSFAEFGWPVPSPDGRQVLFVAHPDRPGGGARSMLWTRSVDSLTPRPLAGTEGAIDVPAWSPDSQSVAFFAGGELRRLSLGDGMVQTICAMPSPGNGGADWSREGAILFSAGGGNGRLYTVAATGGQARPLTTLDASRGETSHHLPQFLPGGRRFLFTIDSTREENRGLYVASLDAPAERRQVAQGWLHWAYGSGHLLVARDGTLYAQPFDPARAERNGEPVAIASPIASWTVNTAIGFFGVSAGGTLASLSGGSVKGQVQLAWVDRKGGQIRTVGAPAAYQQIALSPDERNVAFELWDGASTDLWVMDAARGVTSRLTATPGLETNPVWAPDGRSLIFSAFRDGKADVRRKGLRASDAETVLLQSGEQDFPESWSPDGGTILFVRLPAAGAQNAFALAARGRGTAEAVVTGPFRIDEPHLSPDGRWLAFMSSESGRDEVYVEPFRRRGERARVSVDGGGQPRWRGDGKEIFFTAANRRLQAVAVRPVGERLEVSLPSDLFELRVFQEQYLDDYEPSTDGQRFFVKLPAEQDRKPQLQVVMNWTALRESPAR